MPVSGTFNAFLGVMQLLFDRALHPAVLDPSNWHIVEGLTHWTGVTAQAGVPTAAHVQGNFFNTGIPAPPGKVVAYSPPPFDLTGTTGVPVAAFANFPLT